MSERAVIYGRASRDPNATGASVTKQIERGREWCSREDVAVVAEHRDDNRSASRGARERPGYAQVRALVEKGAVDLLVLWEASRSTRDLEEFTSLINMCVDRGVALVVSGARYDPASVEEWLPLILQGVMAEAEARRIKKRNQDSVDTNARRGTPHGRVPYGYRRVYDPRTGALVDQTPFVQVDGTGEPVRDGTGALVPVLPKSPMPMAFSPEAQVLHDAARDVLAGVTLRQICRDLTARGVPTPRKPRAVTLAENPAGVVTQWEPATLRQLLLNATIAGRRIHRKRDVGEASWAPIVEYNTWLRLHAYMKNPERLTVAAPRGPAPRHLLSGIAKCGECEGRLKAATNLSRMPVAYVCRIEGCMRVTCSGARADERVEAVVVALLERPGFRGALTAAQRRREQAAADSPDVSALIAAKEAELAEVHALRDADGLTLTAYAAETKRIETAIKALREREVPAGAPLAVRRLLSAETLRAGWDDTDLMGRREILRLLLDVKVRRAVKVGRVFDPDRIEVRPSAFLREVAG